MNLKIIIPYNHFMISVYDCEWSCIAPNKRNQLIEKNRTIWANSQTPIKNKIDIKNWIKRLKSFCFPIEIKNGLIIGLNLEIIYLISSGIILKAAYESFKKSFENSYVAANGSLKIDYIPENINIDYGAILHDEKYYFVTFENFILRTCNEIELNQKK